MSGQNYIAFIQGHLLFQTSKYYFCIATVYHPSHKEKFMAIVITISSAQAKVSSIFLFVIEEIFRPSETVRGVEESLIPLLFKYRYINVFLINGKALKSRILEILAGLKTTVRKVFLF